METKLHIHEWLAVVMLCAMAVILALVARWNGDAYASVDPEDAYIHVDIEGAVRYPGSYRFQPGAQVADLVKVGEPLPEADLKRIRGKNQLKNGQILFVKELPMIQVTVVGAVKDTQPLQVPRGTRLVDLLGLVAFEKNADVEKIKKRRRLKNGETITIPVKTD